MCAEYEAMLDGTGTTPSPTFNQALAEAHSFFQFAYAYDTLIAKNKFNALQAGARSIAESAAQQPNVVMALHALMKRLYAWLFQPMICATNASVPTR
jgi:hypothetical protein